MKITSMPRLTFFLSGGKDLKSLRVIVPEKKALKNDSSRIFYDFGNGIAANQSWVIGHGADLITFNVGVL